MKFDDYPIQCRRDIYQAFSDFWYGNVSFAVPLLLKRKYPAWKPDGRDEEVFTAARTAQCEEFIKKLPRGYDTPARKRELSLLPEYDQEQHQVRQVVQSERG